MADADRFAERRNTCRQHLVSWAAVHEDSGTPVHILYTGAGHVRGNAAHRQPAKNADVLAHEPLIFAHLVHRRFSGQTTWTLCGLCGHACAHSACCGALPGHTLHPPRLCARVTCLSSLPLEASELKPEPTKTEPLVPPTATTLMTNSAKYAHYAPALVGRAVRYGSLADCVGAATSGRAARGPPRWLQGG